MCSNKEFMITSLPKGRMCAIICKDKRYRKIIHQYLETHYPHINKISLINRSYDTKHTYLKKCRECNAIVPLLTYHEGYMENNQDEYYYGFCSKCGEMVSWEPNFDESCYTIHHNNMIVLSQCITFHKPSHATGGMVTREEFIDTIKSLDTFEINDPPTLISKSGKVMVYSKKQIQEYVNLTIIT